MWFKNIDIIPKEITNAQQSGRLVIFAGAGISKAKPSDLPNFKELTEKIAENTQFQGQVKSPYEQVLGQIEKTETDIRNLAHQILSSKNSNPSQLHHLILKLFNKNKVRLVTTNFDTHFSSILKEQNLDVETYYAPALPLRKRL